MRRASLILIVLLALSCRQDQNKNFQVDTPTYGTINISVDESFRPVIEEQIKMYEASFPGTKIIPHFKPEAECFKDLFKDTTNRMVIVTRGLSDREENFLKDSLNYTPGWNAIAWDAVAVIVNHKSNDTLFSLVRLQQQLTGRINRDQTIVFDGLAATSTVRFIIDSVLKGKSFDTSVVKAASNTKEAIEYVASHEDAIGLAGINWIGNPEDSAQINMLTKVKIAYVQCLSCKDTPYVKPMQVSILTKRYPLVRGLYYIIKENYNGLGSGFVNFLKYERGQLIFKRAYLGPVMGFGLRNVKINQKIPNK
ncbi:MAG TPA: substrate-binding domain-containing protein [Ferruginibacter sp.]|nr:substrate-binding domain-containing protein [Ferruginibacter sp.]